MAARRALTAVLLTRHPDLDDIEAALAAGRVRVDGVVITNPRSQVRPDARIEVATPRTLQGTRKLGFALDHFGVDVAGRVALDVGACTGGFTVALLERGARLVHAVDVGFGQLLGSLRQDPRVRNLERTNLGVLTRDHLDEQPDLIVVDVSNLALAAAVAQLTANLDPAPGTELVGLVKPMFELRRAQPPTDEAELAEAVARAAAGAEEHGWDVLGSVRSAMTGHRGAVEHLLHLRSRPRPEPDA
ncbi:MAG TPA: SAM-dependent methyltransferase [Acidimicrobiales bacterium]|nr:SAM-dependent methyltransferase [Acidimicrobiales bacterium]